MNNINAPSNSNTPYLSTKVSSTMNFLAKCRNLPSGTALSANLLSLVQSSAVGDLWALTQVSDAPKTPIIWFIQFRFMESATLKCCTVSSTSTAAWKIVHDQEIISTHCSHAFLIYKAHPHFVNFLSHTTSSWNTPLLTPNGIFTSAIQINEAFFKDIF